MAEFSSNTDEINSPPICNTSSDSHYNAVILGGTGATGKYVVAELLLSTLVRKVTLISRREYQLPSEYASSINLDSPDMKPKLIQHFITDIASVDPSQARSIFDGQHALINCLGTTRNAAGSNERMTAIDHDIPMFFARFAHDAGVRHASILTSNGSNPNSMFFYFKLKGRIEESFLQLNFPCLSIWRPGMLERGDQRRFVEKVGNFFLPSLNTRILARAIVHNALNTWRKIEVPVVRFNSNDAVVMEREYSSLNTNN